MSTINRPLTGILLAGAAAAFVAVHPAAAQQRLYRVLDLGTLAGGPPSRPLGINNDGAVVGQGNAGTELHAFIWLPRPLYGFTCNGPHDLNVLAPATPTGNSIAHDVNKTFVTGQGIHEAAQIVGQAAPRPHPHWSNASRPWALTASATARPGWKPPLRPRHWRWVCCSSRSFPNDERTHRIKQETQSRRGHRATPAYDLTRGKRP